jgi:hypothetical protein
VFYDRIDGVGVNVVQLATGAILLAAEICARTFTVGDFALFVRIWRRSPGSTEITRCCGYIQTACRNAAMASAARAQPPVDHGAAHPRCSRSSGRLRSRWLYSAGVVGAAGGAGPDLPAR